MEDVINFCKRKGFIFPTAEIYGGFQGFYDYGPLGVELKNNIRKLLWDDFVKKNDLVVGMEGSVITNPKVWVASEHVDKFVDLLSKCSKCGNSVRIDTLIQEKLGVDVEGLSVDKIKELLSKNEVKCPFCGSRLREVQEFHLMFETNVGPEKGNRSFLRPETAQLIFADFKTIFQTSRLKLPFGIAQLGKAFRNEISPRNFLFRLREFEQFEIEFFVNPKDMGCPFYKEIKDKKINVAYGQEFQKKKVSEIGFASEWHAYWVYEFYNWFKRYGINERNLRVKAHPKDKLAHYAKACIDIEYRFPFGWKEIHGDADRGTFDLSRHQLVSKEKLEIFDNGKVLPYVAAEPSQGIERALLAFIYDAYSYDNTRENVVLKLNPALAPVKVAVFPLVKKDGLDVKAREIYERLKDINAFYDASGSIGRRYARQDEIGTPFCVTIDYDTLKDDSVTVRDRDTTEQERVKIGDLKLFLEGKIYK